MKYIEIHNLIHDEELKKIPVKECGDDLIYVKELSGIKINNFSSSYLKIPKNSTYVRKKVYEKLKSVCTELPRGYSLLIIDIYRPLKWQLERFLIRFAKLKVEYPKKDFDSLFWKTSQWVAPVWGIVPPHTTGGAVDLTLLKNNEEIDMGTKVNEFNDKTQTLTENSTEKQKKNRKILINAMTEVGFINYPTEWWHWSYGDQYWAAVNKKNSIYDTIEIKNGNN